MNYRIVLYMVGRILQIEGALLVLPFVVSLIYNEECWLSFLITIALALALGFALTLIFKKNDQMIFAREGFAIVSLAWILLSLVGALPFYISREIPQFADAFFETVSGFTTTGASILQDVEAMSKGLLFWRSFTHWVGGMGVLVFVMAIFPQESGRSIHIMRAEMPGPIVGKIVPKIKDTAKILYLIYIVMTVIQVILLLLGGMNLFESLVHSMGTAGTGGFSAKSNGIAGYSPYIQWVITVFMLLFGVNFNLYYLILIKRFSSAFKSGELWCYIGIVLAAVTAVSFNIYPLYQNLADVIRTSSFQVASIVTTTGYSTVDFAAWPSLSRMILIVLMFIGGCAGSTAGGIKVSRVLLGFKSVVKDLKKMIHPRSVGTVRYEGRALDQATSNGIASYFTVYFLLFFVLLILISFEPYDFETLFSALAACFNNVGPGLSLVGPSSNFGFFSTFTKYLLSFAMLFGRLEIYPMLLALTPSFWKKK
ncbi:MAG: TrkH family potassium uptake protein [Clostridia bacterium]|nr:TrkH family potassium uptake protein [Clostridia bacterium]